jgi:hypothetical protein
VTAAQQRQGEQHRQDGLARAWLAKHDQPLARQGQEALGDLVKLAVQPQSNRPADDPVADDRVGRRSDRLGRSPPGQLQRRGLAECAQPCLGAREQGRGPVCGPGASTGAMPERAEHARANTEARRIMKGESHGLIFDSIV